MDKILIKRVMGWILVVTSGMSIIGMTVYGVGWLMALKVWACAGGITGMIMLGIWLIMDDV